MCERYSLTLKIQPQVEHGTHASSKTQEPHGCSRSVGTRALLGRSVTRRSYESNGEYERLRIGLHRTSLVLDANHRDKNHDARAHEASPCGTQNPAIAGQNAHDRMNVRWWNDRR